MKTRTLLGVLASLLLSAFCLEGIFFILNRLHGPIDYGRRWFRPYHVSIDESAHLAFLKSTENGRYEIPNSWEQLKKFRTTSDENPVFDRVKIDYSKNYPSQGFWTAQAYRLIPNVNARSIVRRSDTGEILWNTHLRTDEFGRRFTENPNPSLRTKHLLFFGCSYIFGEGMEEDQSVPAVVAKLAPSYFVYNYAVTGAGPADNLARLQDMDFHKELGERKDGVAIYSFLIDHLWRSIPGQHYGETYRGSPYFKEQSDGSLRRYSSFEAMNPLAYWAYRMTAYSETLMYFKTPFPLYFDNEDFRYVVRLIKEMKDVYKQKTGSDQFYVLIWPGNFANPLAHYLSESKIKYLNYGKFDPRLYVKGSAFVNPWDGHPSAELDNLVAHQLVKDLSLEK